MLQREPGTAGRQWPPPKILVGWATVHLAVPIIGLHVRLISGKLVKPVPPDVRF